jgi:hypothetical protein
MRRKDSHVGFGKSFDSFLSIVTKNGLGMLILVAMASTFTSEQTLSGAKSKFKRNLGTPILKPAPFGLKPVYFECQGNRVLPIDLDFLRGDVDYIFGLGKIPDQQRMQERNAQKRANDYHMFDFHPDVDRLKVVFRPKDKAGFHLDEFKKADPAFGKYLGRWNAADKYLFFLVRSDSFQVFREVRDFAKAKGFQIGWDPMAADKELYFVFGFGLGGLPHVDG